MWKAISVLYWVAPTGSGKTVIAGEVVRRAVAKGKRVLFLAHREELIQQASAKLHTYGIEHGLIKAGHVLSLDERVQVAGIQTLWSRAYRGSTIEKPEADLIVVDEAHHARSRTWSKILDSYPDAIVLGLTATPCRGDGRGLGNIFANMVECPSVAELIKLGFLVPTRTYAPFRPDLNGVKVQRGDYVEKQLAEVMDEAKLVGDIVEHWHRLAERRKTVVFASGVQHSIHIRDEFRRANVMAEHIDGTTPPDERKAILAKLSAGQVEVVTNCMVLTEGWDQPDVSCLVLARPTKHMGLYRQMLGRVLRPAPSKSDAIILDHAGAVFELGFAEDSIKWTLDEDKRAANSAHDSRRSRGTREALATCPECTAVRNPGQECRVLWNGKPKRRGEGVEVAEGELGEVDRSRAVKPSQQDKERFYRELKGYAYQHGPQRWLGVFQVPRKIRHPAQQQMALAISCHSQ